MIKIPIYQPFIGKEEETNLIECIRSTWISSKGDFINSFEEKVKTFVDTKYASAVANGTVALHLALLAAGVKQGDEVITTNFTYVASTNAILMVGAKPVFVELNPENWNIDVTKIEDRINSKTKAILITNIYGLPCDFDVLKKICMRHSIPLIEDAAESFGATYKGKQSGSLGDISTFSFFGNKTITTGEGGMVLTNSRKYYNLVEQLKNQGNSPDKKYYHDILGYNYRMTNMQASIGCAQMSKLNDILSLKKNVDDFYRSSLRDKVEFQKIDKDVVPSYWISSILLKNQSERKQVEKALTEKGIETRPLFYPIDELPFYKKNKSIHLARELYDRGLSLPSYPALTDDQLKLITTTIKNNV